MPLYVRIVRITVPPNEAAPAVEGHLDHLRRLRRDGALHYAGAFSQGDGFVDMFEAQDRLDADAIARSSPLVRDGLAAWIVREWAPARLD